VLPVCIGEGTKLAPFLLEADKEYEATVRFGVETDTLDAEGQVVSTHAVTLDETGVRALLPALIGPQLQRPPAHAALKFRGRAYYDYARAGEDVPREPRPITVHALSLVGWQPPDALVDVTCSKGTYVRVIAAELGARAGCGAHLAALRRLRTGGFDVAQAVTLEALEVMPAAQAAACLMPVDTLLAGLPRAELDEAAAAAFLQGRAVAVPGGRDGPHGVFLQGRVLGVADVAGGVAQPRRTVATHAPPGEAA